MAQNFAVPQNAVNTSSSAAVLNNEEHMNVATRGDRQQHLANELVENDNPDIPPGGAARLRRSSSRTTGPALVGAVAGIRNSELSLASREPASPMQLHIHGEPRSGAVPISVILGGRQPALAAGPLYNWQATKTTLKERFQYLHNNETLSDVRFIVGRGMQTQRIPAHKFVLSAGSAVFDAMFNGILATQSSEVELPDVEPAAFLELLRFLYTDEVNIGPETVMTTLYTAKKYAVPALESHCVDFLKKNLGPHNAFMLLTQARLFDEPQLASLCLESIDQNTAEAISADGFTDIDHETLKSVLERDTLGIRENRLFVATERWAEAECERQELEVTRDNKRKALGGAVNLIRFPIMSIEEFAQGPAQSGVLTEREVVDLFLYFHLNPKPRVRFSDRPRCCLTGKEQCVHRFIEVAQRWGYSGTSDRIRFKVNRRIYVVGFGLYGAIHGPADYQVNLQVVETDTGVVIGHNDTGFNSDGSDKRFRVMFKEPVEILPNVSYSACATLNGPDSYYGTRGHRKVNHESPNGMKTQVTFTYAPGNNNGTSPDDGQIPEIIFYT